MPIQVISEPSSLKAPLGCTWPGHCIRLPGAVGSNVGVQLMAACRIDADAASCTIKAGEDARRCLAIGLTNSLIRPWCSAAGTARAPGGPPKAEPGAGSAGPGAAQQRRLRTAYILNEIFEPASFPGP